MITYRTHVYTIVLYTVDSQRHHIMSVITVIMITSVISWNRYDNGHGQATRGHDCINACCSHYLPVTASLYTNATDPIPDLLFVRMDSLKMSAAFFGGTLNKSARISA